MKKKTILLAYSILILASTLFAGNTVSKNQANHPSTSEKLNRGIQVVRIAEDSLFVSWRLLHTDKQNTTFDIYKVLENGKQLKINDLPISQQTHFAIGGFNTNSTNQFILKSSDGVEEPFKTKKDLALGNYFDIPVKQIEGYAIGDGSAADLDGDGRFELIVKREMAPRDNSHKGTTGQTKLEAYKLDGTFLWRIDLGINIREGAHYTQFMVFDLDGDGKAEVVCKTSDGTIDGIGKILGDSSADHRNQNGHIVKGPEYLTVFDGLTGAELHTVNYIPSRHPSIKNPSAQDMKNIWGDDHFNRSERYLATIAYLDGKNPSVVMCRGYYTRSVLAAFDYKHKKLQHRWTFDSDDKTPGNRKYRGQGNHNLTAADVDGDGKDEIVYGAACIDDNGKGLYSTGLKHGDAIHVSDLDPERPGMEVFMGHESQSDIAGAEFRDAKTGELIWGLPSQGDVGRSLAADIDPRHPGYECWTFGPGMSGLYSAQGKKISDKTPRTCNFRIFWDGDLQHELLDRNFVAKYDWEGDSLTVLMRDRECRWNNGTKATPVLSADLFGDWREEIVWRKADNSGLRVYISTIPTNYRFVTLMQDRQYRTAIAWQNVAYNQPPSTSFLLSKKK